MLEFKRRVLEFTLDDIKQSLTYPTVKQIRDYSKSYEKAEDQFQCVIDFLATLGLKKDISENMEMPHLNKVIEALTNEKK